jgi:hypothetical protein
MVKTMPAVFSFSNLISDTTMGEAEAQIALSDSLLGVPPHNPGELAPQAPTGLRHQPITGTHDLKSKVGLSHIRDGTHRDSCGILTKSITTVNEYLMAQVAIDPEKRCLSLGNTQMS